MKIEITKKIVLLLLIIGAVVVGIAYYFSPEVQTVVNNGLTSASIIIDAFVASVVVTPWWQAYFAPYLLYWSFGVLLLGCGIGAQAHKLYRNWRISGGVEERRQMGITAGGLPMGEPSGTIVQERPVPISPKEEQNK